MIGKWMLNILIGLDQFGNAVLGGDPDESISSRLGKLKIVHGGSIPWRRPLSKVIDWGPIEEDEGADAVFDTSVEKKYQQERLRNEELERRYKNVKMLNSGLLNRIKFLKEEKVQK